MFVPAVTVAGPDLVTARSVTALTVVVMVELLLAGLGSVVLLLTLAVLTMLEPSGALEFTCTTMVKDAEPAGGKAVGSRAAMFPVLPAAGAVTRNAGPLVCASETKVVLAGTASVNSTPWASLGPLFVKVIV